ncbi:hypothetical protein ARMGADRAFT_911721, partial [Armillaria gallica]
LMCLGLFPATLKHHETAFTFWVLKQFHVLFLQDKILSYNFINSLACLTDGAFWFNLLVCILLCNLRVLN